MSFTYQFLLLYYSISVCGWLLSAFGILQLPTFAGLAFYKRRMLGIPEVRIYITYIQAK